MKFAPANTWNLQRVRLTFDRIPKLMGIVNVTPDSFTDGGKYFDQDAAIAHALQLDADGADILDVGGESTRPYSDPVNQSDELERVLGVVAGITEQTDTPVSIDTSKAAVARAAIEAGAQIINDVTALTGDPQMVHVAMESGAGVCAMHMRGTPQTMQDNPSYDDVVADILDYLRDRKMDLIQAGIEPERICLDPGIGFGKTHQHNLELIQRCHVFHELGCPVLVGHSRKGFVGKLLGDQNADRDAATLGITLSLAAQQIQVIRVHEVRRTRDALKAFVAAGGLDHCDS